MILIKHIILLMCDNINTMSCKKQGVLPLKTTISHIKGLHFEGEGNSKLRIQMDASVTSGGSGHGASPLELILMAIAGSSGINIVSILEKMNIKFDRFKVDVRGEQTENHPRTFMDIELIYKFWGKELSELALKRAIDLSIKKYCSVTNMIDKAANIAYSIEINPE